jgi:Pyruvate/2-oxoacid:ferredoxin oxidoreductase delta subunit
MNRSDVPMHYVCTREEFREILKKHDRFWVSNCGCREANESGCKRSRSNLCLTLTPASAGSGGSNRREVTRDEVEAILKEAEEKHLVVRPFRSEDRSAVEGSCFCCDDCCAYFLDPKEKCDKGAMIEMTRADDCTDCGACVDVCYFKARTMTDGKLVVGREQCYGCGLCRDVCPADCIEVSLRP